MFRKGSEVKQEELVMVSDWGGIGDMVSRVPAIRYLLRRNPHALLTAIFPDYFVHFAQNALREELKLKNNLGNQRLQIVDFTRAKQNPFKSRRILDFSPLQITSLRCHLVEHAFRLTVDEIPPLSQWSYPTLDLTSETLPQGLKKPYVVVTTGFTAEVREWLPHSVNSTVKWLKSNGYRVVFLGKENTETGKKNDIIKGNFNNRIDYKQGLNLLNKTTLLQAAKIMSEASAVVGLDNGLLHVAGCTSVPIVAGYSTVRPNTRLPIRDGVMGKDCVAIVPDKSLECRFCQTNMNFLLDHDFRLCYYRDLKCLKQLTASEWIEGLKKVLK